MRSLINHAAFVKGYVATSEGVHSALAGGIKKKQLSFIIKQTGREIISFSYLYEDDWSFLSLGD